MPAAGIDQKQGEDILTLYRLRPDLFVQQVLGHDLWSMQEQIIRDLSVPNARVAVKACHSVGKTLVSSDVAVWHTATGGITLTTAPTWTQVEKLLWGYIHRTFSEVGEKLGGQLNKTEWIITPNVYAKGLSTNEGVRFQGYHGEVLVILDEAVGVRPDIWEAIEGIRAGGDVRVLALGNPTVASGPFYDTFRNDRSGWKTYTISAFDTPNLQGVTLEQLLAMDDTPGGPLDKNVRPYLVKRRWVYEKYHEWGPDSPLWYSRVLGEFPPQSDDSLISLAWIDNARVRQLLLPEQNVFHAGVDVAGPGESETVCVVRHGGKIVDIKAWTKSDPREDLAQMLAYWKFKSKDYNSLEVNVDSAGNGWYFYLFLKDRGFNVTPVNVGSAVAGDESNKAKYTNLKAQLYWQLRETFRDGGVSNLKDDVTMGQLAALRYKEDERGRIKIETKDEMQRRGVQSPDRAEALMLAYTSAPVVADRPFVPIFLQGSTSGGWSKVQLTPFAQERRDKKGTPILIEGGVWSR
jgi:phage terminase large subunit